MATACLLVLTYIYLKENNTIHLVVRKSSRAEQPVEYLLPITPSYYLSQKLSECSLGTFSLLSLALFPSLYAHSQQKNDTDATFTQLLTLPTKASAGIR